MLSELRKTRNQQRTERRRQALLDAAGKVFTRQGFHRTLVSDIVALKPTLDKGLFTVIFRIKERFLKPC